MTAPNRTDPGPRLADDRAPLLLDLDGTLVDTLDDIAASANWVRARFGAPPLSRTAVGGMVGDGVQMLLRRALSELRPDAADQDAFWAEVLRLYRDHHVEQCTVHVTPYPGVRELLERWRQRRRAVAVVTNKPEPFARRILDHLELSPCLAVVIGGDTLRVRKPDPQPLWTALDQLGVPRAPAGMVGDGVQDLRAGRAAGLRTAAALYGYGPPAILRAEGADEYWECFGGRSGAKP